MARHLVSQSGDCQIPCLSLDFIAWNANLEREPLEKSIRELRKFLQANDRWVMEGCYADLIEVALPDCTELHFLNPGEETCLAQCKSRSWEPEKFASAAEQQAMLPALIDWVKEYETRQDECGLSRHKLLYQNFTGRKREYQLVADYPSSSRLTKQG